MMLSADVRRTNNKMYEEINIPISEPAPISVGNNLIPISSLDEVRRIFLMVHSFIHFINFP
jgi:activating signal cointegrator complex subunit 3